MKVFIALLLCSFVALIASEQCLTASNCHHVTCDAGHQVDCHQLKCTCTDTDQSCSANGDCSGSCRRDWHCVDGVCRCGFGIGLPGIGK